MTYTLVIASYKYGHLGAHAIESALSQTKKFDKILFVDDGVGDCAHLPLLYPQVEFILRNENLGIVKNFQDMLEMVETDMVIFLGADNWLRSDALELLSNSMANVVTYDIMVTGELKNEIYQFFPNDMKKNQGDWHWERYYKHHGSMMYNVKMAKELGGYEHNRTSTRTDEDLNLWDKFINANATLGYVNQPLLYYRRHKENFNKY
jgi:glycosyltransferase involved in cell wall biosynthesis